jgi:hypothetical protein
MWLKSDGFVDQVKGWWEFYQFEGTPSFILLRKLRALKMDLKKWNAEVFGNVLIKKRQAMTDLNEVEAAAKFLHLFSKERDQKQQLVKELERSFLLEEINWHQKSQALWFQEGDKNNKFFHRVANSNRRYNSISSLLINVEMSADKEAISTSITQFY